MKVTDFKKMKATGEKISFVTCYDFTSAQIAAASKIDCILVGDSLAMTMYGYETTVNATSEMMLLHTGAVVRGAPNKFIVGDLPFLSYRKSLSETMDLVHKIMFQGAHAIKLEGVVGNIEAIEHIVASGVPVMGHIGLTPQSIHGLGGFKVQGRSQSAAKRLFQEAIQLQDAGCFSIVLECVPSDLAAEITEQLEIPTIGIGAGPGTSGQVLVWQDLLGLQENVRLKFVKQYMNGFESIKNALNGYVEDIQNKVFPDPVEHSFLSKHDT